jgi:quinol monooxygenase YgiN
MDEIKGIARVWIHPGKLDKWKRLTEQALEIVRDRDPGPLQYEVLFNDDESEAIVFERYRDADAALEHFANLDHLMEPLVATATVTGEVSAPPTRRCVLSSATANRKSSPRGWPHTTRRHRAGRAA